MNQRRIDKLLHDLRPHINNIARGTRGRGINSGRAFGSADVPHLGANQNMGAMLGMYQAIPGLTGLWVFNSVQGTTVYDLSPQGRDLTTTGSPPSQVSGLMSCLVLDGSTQYASRADEAALDLTTQVCFGGWFYITSLAASRVVYSKWTTTGDQRAYVLQAVSTGAAYCAVSADGAAGTVAAVTGTAGEITVNNWFFMAGRYIASTSVDVYFGNGLDNLVKYSNTSSIPATIKNSSASLIVGGHGGTSTLPGKAAMCWIAAAALDDNYFRYLYESSKWLFGLA